MTYHIWYIWILWYNMYDIYEYWFNDGSSRWRILLLLSSGITDHHRSYHLPHHGPLDLSQSISKSEKVCFLLVSLTLTWAKLSMMMVIREKNLQFQLLPGCVSKLSPLLTRAEVGRFKSDFQIWIFYKSLNTKTQKLTSQYSWVLLQPQIISDNDEE